MKASDQTRMSHIDPPDDEPQVLRPKRARPELTPNQRALGLLVRREHSRKELARKLAGRGVEAEQAQAAVDRMTAEGWQDDARFAEQLVRSRAGTGYGPLRIRAELGTHGLDREAIAAALEAYDGDWAENARDLVRRRFGAALEDRGVQRKAAELLIRRGFGGDQVRAATRFDPDEVD
jgi:regulatory protein